jgi:tetratricopeptide (TPR) repeat protein
MIKLSPSEFWQFLRYLWPRRKTKYGLSLTLAFLFLATSLISIETLTHKIILAGAVVLIFVWWLYDSGRIIFPSKKTTIAFALKAIRPESQIIIEESIIKLKEKLNLIGESERFRIIEIGSDLFSTNGQAQKYIIKKKINLVIHGNLWNEKKESHYVFDLKNFFYSFIVHAEQNSPEYFSKLADIELAIANRDWQIDEVNSLRDLEKVSTNFVEIILSIAAIAFSNSEKHVHLSIALIEHILPFLESHLTPEERKIEIQENQTAKISVNLLRSGRLKTILHGCYLAVGRRLLLIGKYQESLIHCKRALSLGVSPIDSLTGLAIAAYYLNDIDGAIGYTEQIKKYDPHNRVYYVNMAFLLIIKEQYDQAITYYEDFRKRFTSSQEGNVRFAKEIVQFLTDQIEKKPNEYGLLFAKGIIIYNLISKSDGIVILRKFYGLANNITKYKNMSAKTERIIN